MAKDGLKAINVPIEKISKPITLLAFLGVVIEVIISSLAFFAKDSPYFFILALASLILPLYLISLIYRLITKYHYRLYTPSDFSNEEHFLKVIEITTKEIEEKGKTNSFNIFKPFMFDSVKGEVSSIYSGQNTEKIERFLNELDSKAFLSLHSYFNSQEKHDLALLCIDIAISKGPSTSEWFSFRSGSLRKLGRINEALHSAIIATEIENTNIDAHYNLAKIYTTLKKPDLAKREREIVESLNDPVYKDKLDSFFELSRQ